MWMDALKAGKVPKDFGYEDFVQWTVVQAKLRALGAAAISPTEFLSYKNAWLKFLLQLEKNAGKPGWWARHKSPSEFIEVWFKFRMETLGP